jgi:CRISPR type I-E-associated protein CasB/Cse2
MNPAIEQQNPFITYLESLVKGGERGALAALRRGLGKPPGTALEMARYVVPFLPRERPWTEDAYFLVAALFAYWHQGRDAVAASPPENFGASLALLALLDPQTGPSLDLRVTALLKSHRDDLPVHLRQAAGLLNAKGIPVNWQQLLKDILNWDHEDQFVQRAWARAFWGRRPEGATESKSD